jgi:pre-mRNA-splicing factor CWC22
MFRVVGCDVLYEIMAAHLLNPQRTDADIRQVCAIFKAAFKVMSLRSPAEFQSLIVEPFREMLFDGDPETALSTEGRALVENCLEEYRNWEIANKAHRAVAAEIKKRPSVALRRPMPTKDADKTDRLLREEEMNAISKELHLNLEGAVTHDVDLETSYDWRSELDRFTYDPKHAEHEASYEKIRCDVLGKDWEQQLLNEALLAEEMDAAENAEVCTPKKEQPASGGTQFYDQQDEILARKELYLMLKSSVRAEEAAHKILKSMKPETERIACFMILEGCCEENSFKKFYPMVAEALCRTHSKFQTYFVEALREKYRQADGLDEHRIEYCARFWAQLLRTESISWSSLRDCDILSKSRSQRVFNQDLLQTLARDMGVGALKSRLERDSEIIVDTRKLFPTNATDLSALQLAVDMYESMRLRDLGHSLRVAYDNLRQQTRRKRDRD